MTLSVSPPIRIVAVLGLLLAVAAALFSYTQGRSTDGAAAPVAPLAKAPAASLPQDPIAAATEVAAAANRKAAATAAEGKAVPATKPTPAPPAAPAAKPTLAPKPAVPVPAVPVPAVPVIPASGLPVSIDAALAANRIVVVSLFVPGSRIDEIATAEARAGAELVGAGFVALNAFDEASSRILLVKLGMLEGPVVLVFRRPSEVVTRMDGFADRETVAQAASSAAS